MWYRQSNEEREREREKYRILNQDRIQREENELEELKWGRNSSRSNSNRTRINGLQQQQEDGTTIITVPMKYIVTDGINHYHKTESDAQCREKLNNQTRKSKGLTFEILMEAYGQKGKPFYDP